MFTLCTTRASRAGERGPGQIVPPDFVAPRPAPCAYMYRDGRAVRAGPRLHPMCSLKRSRAAVEDDEEDNISDTSSRSQEHELVYRGSLDLALVANKRMRGPGADDNRLSLSPPTPTLSPANAMDVDADRSLSSSPRPSSGTDLAAWEALKAQHASAMQLFDGESPASAAPVLRRVLSECERILAQHRDPSVIYAPSLAFTPPHTPPPAAAYLDYVEIRQPTASALQLDFSTSSTLPAQPREPVIAFYALYGAALFAFGSLIARDSSLLTSQDYPSAGLYFGRALDVLDYGENHPRRSSVVKSDNESRAENFELAFTYGRTLLYLAAEHVRADLDLTVNAAPLWPSDSPFAPGQLPIPPRRLGLAAFGAPGILALAADQLLRAFLHMPHSGYTSSSVSAASSSMRRCHPLFKTCACPRHVPERERPFPRCRTLNHVGHDMLRVAGTLANGEDRKKWALWADGNAFGQMRWEPEAGGWETVRELARGRCRLLAARACLGEVQAGLRTSIIANAAAEVTEGLDHVQKAVEHLRLAASLPGSHPTTQHEARALLAEAQNMLCVTKQTTALGVDPLPGAFSQAVAANTRPNTRIPASLAIFASG